MVRFVVVCVYMCVLYWLYRTITPCVQSVVTATATATTDTAAATPAIAFMRRQLQQVDMHTVREVYCHSVAGGCFAIGLRFAGTGDAVAAAAITHYLQQLMELREKGARVPVLSVLLPQKCTLEMCIGTTAVSLAMVLWVHILTHSFVLIHAHSHPRTYSNSYVYSLIRLHAPIQSFMYALTLPHLHSHSPSYTFTHSLTHSLHSLHSLLLSRIHIQTRNYSCKRPMGFLLLLLLALFVHFSESCNKFFNFIVNDVKVIQD